MSSKLILIAGGTASGKTTIASKLVDLVGQNNVNVISQDIYYKKSWDKLNLEERKKQNFDHPSSFDWDILEKDLKKLLSGKSIIKSKYDYKNFSHYTKDKIVYEPKKVIVLEGLYSMYEKKIRELSDYKIFVMTDPDIRVIRRINRDAYRLKDIKKDLSKFSDIYINNIKKMHEIYIEPTKMYADIIIPNQDMGINNKSIEIIKSSIKEIIN